MSGGLFFSLALNSSVEVLGQIFVRLLSEYCAKDFQRRAEVSCSDNSKAMMRLRRQCEEAMKQL